MKPTPSPIALPDSWRRKYLTPAEQKVVELAASGRSTKEIAADLGKATRTVHNQLHDAMRKLDIHSRYELIVKLRPVAAPATEPEIDSFAYAI